MSIEKDGKSISDVISGANGLSLENRIPLMELLEGRKFTEQEILAIKMKENLIKAEIQIKGTIKYEKMPNM